MIRRIRRPDDAGAALVLVLVIITVIAVVVGALLTFADTSIRTTLKLREQAAETYAADGAAQTAITMLREGTFGGAGNCDTESTQELPNFYPATGTAPGASAAVKCRPDSGSSSTGGEPNASPGSAILTLGTGGGGEHGLYVGSSNNSDSVKVKGGIFSNSDIYLAEPNSDVENVAADSYVIAKGPCSINGNSELISDPPPVCNYGSRPASATDPRGKDPALVTAGRSYDAPPAPTQRRTPPPCTGAQVYELEPGLYTSASALALLTNNQGVVPACRRAVFHFKPGRYYFNFTDPSDHVWRIASGYVVAGQARVPLSASQAPTLPGACVPPRPDGTDKTGVLFVFGGDSRMEYIGEGRNSSASVEICASNSDSGPPIAIYGLKQTIGSGAMTVPAQNGCITAAGYPADTHPRGGGGDAGHCALLRSYEDDPWTNFTIHGTTYAPHAMLDLSLNNNSAQVFRWGLVARGLHLYSTGSSNLTQPVVEIPEGISAPFVEPEMRYLEVYLCPGAGTCDTSGTPRLRVKVLVSPSAPRTVDILSWSSSP